MLDDSFRQPVTKNTFTGAPLGGSVTAFIACLLLVALIISAEPSFAQANGQGAKPILAWTSWSHFAHNYNGAQIQAESDALKSSGLQGHGYTYINMDAGWWADTLASGYDSNGRPSPDASKFPAGIASVIQHIHNNGQKAGIYYLPGVAQAAYAANDVILGTTNTTQSIATNTPGNQLAIGTSPASWAKINYAQPGAQAYINSIVNEFASWGVDYIKIDFVTPGSGDNDTTVDNRPDIQAWSAAIAQSGRPMWLDLSSALDIDYIRTWQQYANSRRIESDIECYCKTLTGWPLVAARFSNLASWQYNSGPTLGWNNLDSIEVGNGSVDGLTNDERQSMMTFWSIANSPLSMGDDLTNLDSFGLQLLSNDNFIAVDQTGYPGLEPTVGNGSVWASPQLSNGTFSVALFNLGSSAATTTISWSTLGFSGSADVFDLWNNVDLGSFTSSYGASLNTHASTMLRVTPTTPISGPVSFGHKYLIVNKNSGKVLDDPNWATANSTSMDQWQSNGGTNQQWVATPLGSSWVFINVASSKVLDVPGNNNSPGTVLDQFQFNGAGNQRWNLVAVGDGTFKIVSAATALVMDVSSSSTANGASVIEFTDHNGINQHWTFQLVH